MTSSIRARDVGEFDLTFWELRKTCALGRVLHLGSGGGEFVQRLLEHGVDAFGTDVDTAVRIANAYTPGRSVALRLGSLPFEPGSFDTIVCLDAAYAAQALVAGGTDTTIDRAIAHLALECRRVARRHVLLRLAGGAERDRDRWDVTFLRNGFRKHPACLTVSAEETLLYERAEVADHLSRSFIDARLRQYAAATRLIRANDVVLDIHGSDHDVATLEATGRASHIIRVHGDSDALRAVADHSVDLVVTFDVAGAGPARDLVETVCRVLKPGGRVITAVCDRRPFAKR